MEVICYGQIKVLTLNENSVRAAIEIDLTRGLIDDLLDLKRRGQFRLRLEPFQVRLGETVMDEIRAFAEKYPYVRVEVPKDPGCNHPEDRRSQNEAGFTSCMECGEVLNRLPDPPPETEAAEEAPPTAADAAFDAMAAKSRNHRSGLAVVETIHGGIVGPGDVPLT